MDGAVLKLVALAICLNTFTYLGVEFSLGDSGVGVIKVPGDMFDLLLDDRTQLDSDMRSYSDSVQSGNYTVISRTYQLSGNFTTPQKEAGEGVSELFGFTFLDSLRIIWSVLATLLNIAFVPIILFSISTIPPFLTIMIGLPLSVLTFISFILVIRH